jgi:hypothetical protein
LFHSLPFSFTTIQRQSLLVQHQQGMLLCPQFLKGTLEVPESLRLPFHCDFLDLNLSGLLNRKIHGQMDLKFQRSAQKPHIIPFYQVVDRGFYLGDLTPFLL